MESATPTLNKAVRFSSPSFTIYEDSTVDRLHGTDTVPPSLNPNSPALSKDVVYYPEPNLSSRLYLPNGVKPGQKLPLLVYFHGGAFIIASAFAPTYHNYLNQLVSEANVIAVSVDYRLAPEHYLPTAFDDSWTALKWVASHVNGDGPEDWLNYHVDFSRVFLAGDSAGATLAHQMGIKCGKEHLQGVNINGIILVHPYFWGSEAIGYEVKVPERRKKVEALWLSAHPNTTGLDDPLINPVADPNLTNLGCERVLVIVAEKDLLRDRGWYYYENLKKCGWGGEVEIMEAEGEEHVFHFQKASCEKAVSMFKKIVSFINHVNVCS